MNTLIIRILTLAVYAGMVAANYLAVAIPLGGRSTGEISDNYPNLFTPAGYAFSIWGLIYALLGIYVIYQLLREKDEVVARVNPIFVVNALLNASWIFAWHYDLIWLSIIIMAGLLITLIRITDILRGYVLSQKDYWLVRLPFSVYFGWITVATIANITVFLVYLNWNGFGLADSFWTVVVLLTGAAIGSWRALHDRSIPYALVLIWAYGAILFKHLSGSAFRGQYPAVIAATTISMLIFIGCVSYIGSRRWQIQHAADI